MNKNEIIQNMKLYLFDMDGTLYLGSRLYDFTIELLQEIRRTGGKYLFITNNSSKSVADYVKKLAGFGIEATRDDFMTSSQATAYYLHKYHEGQRLYVCGTESLKEELRGEGFTVTTNIDEVDCIVMGFDTELTFQKLHDVSYMLLTRPELPYIATNPDLVCPTEFGSVPDCGSVCGMIYNATGKTVIDIHGTDNAYFYCLFTNMGCFMIDTETNTTGLASEKALELIKKLREWVDKGYIKWIINDVGNTLMLNFTSGESAACLYTSSTYASYKQKAETGANGVTFEVGIANQPYGDYGTNHQYVAGATMIIPSADCNTPAQKAAAFKLICFLTNPAQQLEWATTSSYYVTRKSASTDPQYAEAYNGLMAKLPEMANVDLNSYVAKTKHELFDKCGDVFEKYMSEIMANDMDPEEGWEIMVEEINDTLADQ